ncbi:MAG: hypothetical protein ACOY90_05895 [Candidatus Zhuqueibacterota bacterium]
MSERMTLIKSELTNLLSGHTGNTDGRNSIAPHVLEGITTIVDSTEIESLEELKISVHATLEKFYIEFEPTSNDLSRRQLEKLFYEFFQIPFSHESNRMKFDDGIDPNPYKLHDGPGGLKLEIENNYDRIKRFRFIVPLQ